MEGKQNETNEAVIDLSQDFLTMDRISFLDRLHEVRKEPILKIEVDLSRQEQDRFISSAQFLKAFVEGERAGQKRFATVRGRQEQISWEPNVFSSGVKFEVLAE